MGLYVINVRQKASTTYIHVEIGAVSRVGSQSDHPLNKQGRNILISQYGFVFTDQRTIHSHNDIAFT